jgi:hypothetical protein
MNRHFVEMLRALRDEGVEHLVIGAHALAAHGYVRATLDIDIWVRPSPENAPRTWKALERFRAPLAKMRPEDFAEPEVLYQIGMPPSRIDIMTSVTGLHFDAAWPRRIIANFGDVEAPVLGGEDLRIAKRAAGRLKDLADLEELG